MPPHSRWKFSCSMGLSYTHRHNNLPATFITSVARWCPSPVIIRPMPTAFLSSPIRTPASIPPIPVVVGPMSVSMDMPMFPVPVLIIVLTPFWGPSFTLGFISLVLTCVPEMAATTTAAIVAATALESVRVMLIAIKVRRWEGLLWVACRVDGLIINLLWHDWWWWRMWHCRRWHQVRKCILSSGGSRHWGIAGIWHWRRSRRKTRRDWKTLPHLMVWKRWPHGTLADWTLCWWGHWGRIRYKIQPRRHVSCGWRVRIGSWRGGLLVILILHWRLLRVKLPQVLRSEGLCWISNSRSSLAPGTSSSRMKRHGSPSMEKMTR